MKTEKIIKSIITLFVVAATTINCKAQEIIYEKADSIFIEDVLRRHPAEVYASTGERIVALAQEFVGKKYVAGTLDEYENEPLYVSCSRLDCTTFVELVVAMAVSDTSGFGGVCKRLEQIRYANGVRNGYMSRLHYISQWIADPAKRGLVEVVTTAAHTARQTLNLNFMSTHPESYPLLRGCKEKIEAVDALEMPFRGIEVAYIPKDGVCEVGCEDVKEGDVIAIVTAVAGLDVSHVGFAHWRAGVLHMIHASSAAGMVVDDSVPLAEYLAKRKNHLGIRVFRVL